MKTFVPKTKSDQKWLDSLICYMDYIHKFMVFPTMNTIYQNKKIGVWMNNQKRFKKVYKMPSERMELLSKVLPVWDKETDEKQQYLEILLQQKWSEWLNTNEHSFLNVQGVLQKYSIQALHDKGIHSCEELIRSAQVLKMTVDDILELYCGIYPFLTLPYARFLCILYYIDTIDDLVDTQKMENFFLSFPYVTKEDTKKHIEALFDALKKKEKDIVYLKLGFKSNQMTFREVGNVYNLSHERVRQIFVKGIRRCRHPQNIRLLYLTYSDLDQCNIHKVTRAVLYRNGIRTASDIITACQNKEHILSLCKNLQYQNDICKFIASYICISQSDARHVITVYLEKPVAISCSMELEELNLSVRAYNCLRRTGMKTVEDLIDFCKDNPEKELRKIRNFGTKCIQELLPILKKYHLYEEIKPKTEEENPTPFHRKIMQEIIENPDCTIFIKMDPSNQNYIIRNGNTFFTLNENLENLYKEKETNANDYN